MIDPTNSYPAPTDFTDKNHRQIHYGDTLVVRIPGDETDTHYVVQQRANEVRLLVLGTEDNPKAPGIAITQDFVSMATIVDSLIVD